MATTTRDVITAFVSENDHIRVQYRLLWHEKQLKIGSIYGLDHSYHMIYQNAFWLVVGRTVLWRHTGFFRRELSSRRCYFLSKNRSFRHLIKSKVVVLWGKGVVYWTNSDDVTSGGVHFVLHHHVVWGRVWGRVLRTSLLFFFFC